MATRQQRRRRLEMARHHQATQRRRLRAALESLPAVASVEEIKRHMTERGYEQDWKTGKWKRMAPLYTLPDGTMSEVRVRRGPSWAGVLAKRKRKGRR